VEQERLVTRTDIANQIETRYEQVHTKEDRLVPVCHSTEKIVEVPQLTEKIVERIHLMPQVHEVTKHIYEITEEPSPGVAVDVDYTEHEAKYKELYGGLKKESDALVSQLRSLQQSHPELSDRIQSLESYVSRLDQTMAHPKIIQVSKDRVVEKPVSSTVLVKRGEGSSVKDEAFYLVLLEKYEKELKEAHTKHNYTVQDEDLKRLFLVNSGSKDPRAKDRVNRYKQS
jgi:hypothetical protein